MELTQVVVSMFGLALVGAGKLTRHWNDARTTRAIAIARMHRYGEPKLAPSPRLSAL